MPLANPLAAFDQERVSVAASSVGLTLSKFVVTPLAQAALISVESAPIRWLDDGTAPTATTGHLANPTDIITLDNIRRLYNFRAIRTGATSATLQVTYYR